jgi:hypothetical protein
MALIRIPLSMLVLLLALTLPLQGFGAAWSCGADHTAGAAAHAHCANGGGKAQSGGEQRHHCGTCCVAAVALMPLRWTAPRCAGSEAAARPQGAPPQIPLDRLDRPPRSA